MENKIIPHYYDLYDSYESFVDNKAVKNGFIYSPSLLDINNLVDYEQLFIVAEPGYGKSTTIKEIKKHLDANEIKYMYFEGHKESTDTITITEEIKYIIFDALDECKDIVPRFQQLISLCKDHKVKLIITNRAHYISSISHLVRNLGFQFIRLLPFNDHQIASFLTDRLKTLDYNKIDITKIIEISRIDHGNSVLKTPRYLNEFCQYIVNSDLNPGEVIYMNKSELFEKVIYYKLESEKTINNNSKYLTKRVLERLALVMEIQGLNQISKEDFITYLDQTNSNISLIFLNSIDLDVLVNRVLKTTGDLLQFENTEFQEYLAAKELSRMGYKFQTIYDLMIDKEFKVLRPNWIDVLNYALDIDPQFVKPLINFIDTKRCQNIEPKLIELLLNIDSRVFDDEFKECFFNTIINYYSINNKIIFNYNLSLSNYITTNNQEVLVPLYPEGKIPPAAMHILCNQILLIEALAKSGRLSESALEIWTDYLISLLKKEYHLLYTPSFYALVAFQKKESILSLINEFEQKEDYLLNKLLIAISQSAPNDERSISLICRCIYRPRRLDNLAVLIDNVSDEKGIITIFELLIQEKTTLSEMHFRYSSGFFGLFDSINKINSKKLDEIIKEYFLKIFKEKAGHFYEIPHIVICTLLYLIKKEHSFLNKIIALESFLDHISEITKLIVCYIDLDTFQKIESLTIEKSPWQLNEFIYKSKNELEWGLSESDIYKYIEEKYLIPWGNDKKSKAASIGENAIEKLRSYYVKETKKFNSGLVPYFINRYDDLATLLEQEDKDYIMGVVGDVLDHYNPDLLELKIETVSEHSTHFTQNHEFWGHIELYIKASYLLSDIQSLKRNRIKVIKSLARIDIYDRQDRNLLEKIIAVIGPLSETDIQLMYDFYINRKDDILALSARAFAEMIRKLGLHKLTPILIRLFENSKISSHDKEEVLKVYGELATKKEESDILKEIFNNEKIELVFKEIANAFLISKFNDKDAICWRFDELRKRLQKFDPDRSYNGMSHISNFESEMNQPKFAKCLCVTEHPLIYSKMLELLTFSFKIRNNRLNVKYSTYLQFIIFDYFQLWLSKKVISDIKKVVAGFSVIEQTYSFNFYLDQLVVKLHQQKKSLEPFVVAVHAANEILSKTYLPLQSEVELKELITRVLNNEIKTLIEDEGLYHVAGQLRNRASTSPKYANEALIQKTLKIALGKALLENGLRKSDIHREVESLDGLKYDYLISYGLYGPIVVELKLMHNTEIQNKTERNRYKKKLAKYLSANKGLGLYVVFQVKDNQSHRQKFAEMVKEYRDIEGLEIIHFRCFGDE